MKTCAYINLSGSYCADQLSKPDYLTVEDLLKEMDRLGIWQTTVEYTRGANALYRNQVMLQDIARIPNARERIIPAFSLEVCSLFHPGELDAIIRMLQEHRPSCVVLTPKTNSYKLNAIDIVLERVSHLNPVILMDLEQIDTPTGQDDLLYLARKFPNMQFVIRKVMYQGWPFVFNTMRRVKNISLDVSWLHTKDAIALACEWFGADRVLYSHGPRAAGGAAMGAIAYAKIPEEDKQRICGKNFIRLFSDPQDQEYLEKNQKAIPHQVPNSLWTPFLRGEGISGVEVYDVHTHLGVSGNSWYLYNATLDREIPALEEDMKTFNIQKVVSSVNGITDVYVAHREVEAAVRGKEDHLKGYVRYNPVYQELYTREYLDERFQTGYHVGLKSLPAYMGTDIRDEKYEPMFRYADEHHMPILLHTWDSQYGTAMACAEAASRWPNAKVILGHSGGGDAGRRECEEIAQDPKYKNVYFEFCGSFTANRTWEDSLRYIDYRRVLFGSDTFLHDLSWELGRLLSLQIPEEHLIAILGQNAKALFGF